MEMDKITEIEMQNLFLMRTMLMNLMIVLTGGIVGLSFMEHSFLKYVFITIGVLVDIAAYRGYVQTAFLIKKNIYRGKKYDGIRNY